MRFVYIKKHHYLLAIGIWFWGVVFVPPSLKEMQEAAQIFNTDWRDFLYALLWGVLIGLLLRVEAIRKLALNDPRNKKWIVVGMGILGLGFIGIGLIGAGLIYWRFNDTNLSRVPLHASAIGLCVYLIHIISNWKQSET